MAVGGETGGGGTGAQSDLWNGSRWSYKQPVDIGGSDVLTTVSCVSSSFCIALGESNNGGGSIERWDGSRWSREAGLTRVQNGVSAVSCITPRSCLAVGSATVRWSGWKWSVLPAPGPHMNLLVGLSCTSMQSCVAVGDTGRDDMTPVAARWHGRRWRVDRLHHPRGERFMTLTGVSCASARSCWAVGSAGPTDFSSSPNRGVVDHWNGKHWSLQPVPEPTPIASSGFNSVSCVAGSGCEAVGIWNLPGPANLTKQLIERLP